MAASINTDGEEELITAINITPMVDIMLVLLIIFMVTASVITKESIVIDLPEAATASNTETSMLGLTLDTDARLYLNGEPISDTALRGFIRSELAAERKVQAVIAADRSVSHGDVIRVIDLVKQEGVHSFAINVDPPSIPGAQAPNSGAPQTEGEAENATTP